MIDPSGIIEDNLTITVNNIAPTVGPITAPINPVQVATIVSVNAAFSDPGIPDTQSAVWNWGDGTTSAGTVTESGGSGKATGIHTYAAAGVYVVKLTVTDDDGGAGESFFRYVVVYDPGAGFVTGGGWIESPAGAFAAAPLLTGKANFGFVSKYKKAQLSPRGSTEFQFKSANLNFRSASYEWLVIAGAKAQWKGTGTINGAGSYRFMLTVIGGGFIVIHK